MSNYYAPSDIVKELHYGDNAKKGILEGIRKLADAVEVSLGASGQCVIFETGQGTPAITKDGVSIAESIVLLDPVENMGSSLIKQAAQNTVNEAGDGTSSSTVLARYLIEKILEAGTNASMRGIKNGVESGYEKIVKYIEENKIEVTNDSLKSVASISCNNDEKLGSIIGDAFAKVGKDGVVIIENSEDHNTYADVVDGVSFDSKLKSPILITDRDRGVAELEKPLVFLSMSPIPNTRKILRILEHCANEGRPLLIVAELEKQAREAILTNKYKGNLKVNFIDPVGFGNMKQDSMEDLAILTGAKLFSEELGDDLDAASLEDLGEVYKSVTDEKGTVLATYEYGDKVKERIADVKKTIENEDNPFLKKKHEQRLAMLSGRVGVVYVGANSEVELKEKKDRVEDAVHATKAALNGGIVSGGGVALKDASSVLDLTNEGEKALFYAINKPIEIILKNALLGDVKIPSKKGWGINAITGKEVNMIKAKIIDPALVVTTALKNAISVAITIASASVVINNLRDYSK